MRRIAFFFLLLITLALSGCSGAQQVRTTVSPAFTPEAYDRIAVLVIDETGRFDRRGWYNRGGGVLRQVETEFMQAVMSKRYTLAARSDVDRVLDELEFQASGATAEDYARVGEMLNVSALLVASVNASRVREEENILTGFFNSFFEDVDHLEDVPEEKYYSEASIEGRLISVRTAEVLWIGQHKGSVRIGEEGAGSSAVLEIARRVAHTLPPH